MNISLSFVRIFFIALCTLFMTVYRVSDAFTIGNVLIGVGTGLVLGLVLATLDTFIRRFNLRAFNLTLLGLFVGYLMSQAILLIFDSFLAINPNTFASHSEGLDMVKISILLFGCYLGTVMTLRSADEIALSIPYIKFIPQAQKRKDLVVDISVLSDPRIIDLATTGIFDHQLIIPRFLVKELYSLSELGEEQMKAKARKSLEVIKKLEALPSLNFRYNDNDFPEAKDHYAKTLRLARFLDCNILTADFSRMQVSILEGIRLINLHTLSNALKPLMQTAEQLKIKIQRLGKEPRQGIGYLEDGTMVVVNGGGNFIGEIIDAQVLSVKHTSSGRMIFCNAQDEDHDEQDEESDEYEDEYNRR